MEMSGLGVVLYNFPLSSTLNCKANNDLFCFCSCTVVYKDSHFPLSLKEYLVSMYRTLKDTLNEKQKMQIPLL